jgi:translation initiation factor 2 beta subunit (eIF-2beta)/eIF-5
MKNPKVRSYICRKEGYIVSCASVIDLMSEYLDHYVCSDIETVEQKDFDDVKKVLAFICGIAPFMPSDGVYGWTFSLPDKGRKIFASLNLKDRTYVCRTHKWTPDKHEKTPRVALQMVSEIQKLNRVSLVDVEVDEDKSETIKKLMERYFEIEAKVKVFTKFQNDELIIFKPFPSCSIEVFEDISKRLEEDPEKVKERLETLEDYRFDFFCGCCVEKISGIFSALKNEDIEFLFKNDEKVTAECPRCGKKYQFKRELCVK